MSETTAERPLAGKLAQVAFYIWCALFVLGAAAELFDLEWLRALTDVKRVFLR